MAETEEDDTEVWLRLKPVEPLPSQCCGSGCSPCVFDLYYRDLERWETARARNDRSLLSGRQPPESQDRSAKLSPETFLAFHISTMEKVTKDTYLVRFTLPGNSQLGLLPGQHLILRGVIDGLEIQRAYTPISPVTAEGYFDVLIKCYQTGLMSRYVESWRTGDTAFWRGPFGSFLYEPNKSRWLHAPGYGMAETGGTLEKQRIAAQLRQDPEKTHMGQCESPPSTVLSILLSSMASSSCWRPAQAWPPWCLSCRASQTTKMMRPLSPWSAASRPSRAST
ncbi:NADH-cytochrome b5 reductase-like isoform X3 [Mus pahari]|uniref:NADH-cytochrome b5 reductase-like isoform X3 n=1 Tax=Mus pahari TaxID=10093 RepID=UPI0011149223|nr:NADH-cytochrome b5 reductase-like isoform X3 [Mus pahari]